LLNIAHLAGLLNLRFVGAAPISTHGQLFLYRAITAEFLDQHANNELRSGSLASPLAPRLTGREATSGPRAGACSDVTSA